MPWPPEQFRGVRLEPPPLRPILLWDGECGFCAACVGLFHRLARRPVLTAPVQPLLASLPPEVRATALRQLLFAEASGTVTGGVRGLANALAAAGRPALARLLTAPLLYPVFRAGYRVVARTRRWWPASSACPLP